MLKVKKFQECTYMRLFSVKQNIEGNANLHHSPGIGLVLSKKIIDYPLPNSHSLPTTHFTKF